MITTDNDDLAKELRLLKDQYRTGQYQHDKVGYGMSLGALQCALGLSQLKRLDELVDKKRKIAQRYHDAFKLGKIEDGHSYWMYAFEGQVKLNKNVETRPAFVPLHAQPPYKSYGFEMSTELFKTIQCLPCSTSMTEEEQNYVINLCHT
jgi:dTDP-4-amino-4,6-dideoxygalactose transaminase